MNIIDPLEGWIEPVSIKKWGETNAPDSTNVWFNFLTNNVHPDVVSVVIRLLIPSFIEHDDGVFLKDQFSLSGYEIWKNKLREITEIEKFMNHQHVYDLFAVNDQVAESSFIEVANLMVQTLRLSLRASFPERTFNVYVSNTDQDYGPTVSFHSVAKQK